jgi:hypothetical protein
VEVRGIDAFGVSGMFRVARLESPPACNRVPHQVPRPLANAQVKVDQSNRGERRPWPADCLFGRGVQCSIRLLVRGECHLSHRESRGHDADKTIVGIRGQRLYMFDTLGFPVDAASRTSASQ